MSLPEIPSTENTPSREEAINQIISSIAMEELGLSHIINAEGEKLQYILGTIPGVSGSHATISEVLDANESIRGVLQSALESQNALRIKLQDALSSAVLTGPTGPSGPTGVKGDMGPEGPTGSTGAPGEAATIDSVTVERVAYAAQPFVRNEGTEYHAILKFGLPEGAPGPAGTMGADGATGPQGERGPQGEPGPKGDTGDTGPTGPTGSEGERGPQGEPGPKGDTGDTGPTGPIGPSAIRETYHVDLTGNDSSVYLDIPLKNVIYRFYKNSATIVRVNIRPATVPVEIDYKRYTVVDAVPEGQVRDSITLSDTLSVDNDLYVASRELQRLWLRQRDPITQKYSTCVVYYWAGGPNAQRTDIWVEWIHEDVVYEAP